MFDGNVAGLLGMSVRDDGTGESYSSNNGSYKQRLKNRENHYNKTDYKINKGMNIDPDTGEILDYLPPKNAKNPYKKVAKSARSSGLNLPSLGKQLPKPTDVIHLVMLGAIGYGAYLLYQRFLKPFGTSELEKKQEDANKIIASSYVDTTSSNVQNNKANATDLAKVGLVVSTAHYGYANTLHQLLDKWLVDHEKIVKIVKGQSLATFKLTSAAYGVRRLDTYATSPAHLFNTVIRLDNLVGSLHKHLTWVLTDSEQSSINKWLNAIA